MATSCGISLILSYSMGLGKWTLATKAWSHALADDGLAKSRRILMSVGMLVGSMISPRTMGEWWWLLVE